MWEDVRLQAKSEVSMISPPGVSKLIFTLHWAISDSTTANKGINYK